MEIITEDECILATRILGGLFREENIRDTYPSGCSWDVALGLTYFNTHPGGDYDNYGDFIQPVCKGMSYVNHMIALIMCYPTSNFYSNNYVPLGDSKLKSIPKVLTLIFEMERTFVW